MGYEAASAALWETGSPFKSRAWALKSRNPKTGDMMEKLVFTDITLSKIDFKDSIYVADAVLEKNPISNAVFAGCKSKLSFA